MTPLTGDEASLHGLLEALVELEMEVIGAYQHVMTGLAERSHHALFAQCVQEHEQHVQNLQACLQACDAPTASNLSTLSAVCNDRGHAAAPSTHAQNLPEAEFAGMDMLGAMNSNEDQTCHAYARSTQRHDLPQNVVRVLERHWQDERRLRGWLQERMAVLENRQRTAQ